jgi:hypothetical protein
MANVEHKPLCSACWHPLDCHGPTGACTTGGCPCKRWVYTQAVKPANVEHKEPASDKNTHIRLPLRHEGLHIFDANGRDLAAVTAHDSPYPFTTNRYCVGESLVELCNKASRLDGAEAILRKLADFDDGDERLSVALHVLRTQARAWFAARQ